MTWEHMTLDHGTLGAVTDRDYRKVKANLDRVLRRLKLGPYAQSGEPERVKIRQGKSPESAEERKRKIDAWLREKDHMNR